jgi:hypothetical protein
MTTQMNPKVCYWTRGQEVKNFGDFLTEYIYNKLLIEAFVPADRYRLIGSVIDEALILEDINGCSDPTIARLVYWCCGARQSRPISPSALKHCTFFGARGPLTRDLLGLPASTPLGDPGFLLPLIAASNSPRSRGTLCIPHYSDPRDPVLLRKEAGAEAIASSKVRDIAELETLLLDIQSAEFVLAGSLHAAIVACAYGVPFGFWDTGFIDIPFKWADFAASIGIRSSFHGDVTSAFRAYEGFQSEITRPDPLQILGCSPFAIRPGITATAALATASGSRNIPVLYFDKDDEVETTRAKASKFFKSTGTDISETVSTRELTRTSERIAEMARQIIAEASGVSFAFSAESTILKFSSGEPGGCYLHGPWSPANDIGPWVLGKSAKVSLPATCRWWSYYKYRMSGFLFCPTVGEISGRQQFSIYLNGALVYDKEYVNLGSAETILIVPEFLVPPHLAARRGALDISVCCSNAYCPEVLGLRNDPRVLSFALQSISVADEGATGQ